MNFFSSPSGLDREQVKMMIDETEKAQNSIELYSRILEVAKDRFFQIGRRKMRSLQSHQIYSWLK